MTQVFSSLLFCYWILVIHIFLSLHCDVNLAILGLNNSATACYRGWLHTLAEPAQKINSPVQIPNVNNPNLTDQALTIELQARVLPPLADLLRLAGLSGIFWATVQYAQHELHQKRRRLIKEETPDDLSFAPEWLSRVLSSTGQVWCDDESGMEHRPEVLCSGKTEMTLVCLTRPLSIMREVPIK